MPSPVQLFRLDLETSLCSATKRTPFPRLDHPAFSTNLQYGMAVMGVIDAFVHAHNPYRRNMDNPGNFGDGMKGRIRFLTAITPACVRA